MDLFGNDTPENADLVVVKEKKISPFDFINSINNKTIIDWDEVVEKAYPAFMVNRGLSFNLKTILFANMMNMHPALDRKMQYDFYFYGVPKGKRFDKWQKKDAAEADIQVIMEFYGINIERAHEALSLLSNEQLNLIKDKLKKGGLK